MTIGLVQYGVHPTIVTGAETWPACWRLVIREKDTSTFSMQRQRMIYIEVNSRINQVRDRMDKALLWNIFYEIP